MAVYLARRGFRVFATMRDLSRREKLEAEAARQGAELEILQLDVTDRQSIHDAVETVARAGGITGLINNAGIQIRGYFEDLSEDEMRRVFETNVFGTMALTRAVLGHMRRAGQGRIVLVSSIGGRLGHVAATPYCSSKFALEGFAETLAFELFPFNIKVTVIEPGTINNSFLNENRVISQRAKNPESPYYAWFCEAERLADWAMRSSTITSEDVGKAVYRALTARRPRLRYVVGSRPALVLRLRQLLPFELFERVYFSQISKRLTRAEAAGNRLR
jgi:NAD(P)-dependent dehydrogenase (short-subunit alcohol dehydrogenase family)